MLFLESRMQSRIGLLLGVGWAGLVAGCSGGMTTIDATDGGGSSSGASSSGAGSSSGSGGSSGGSGSGGGSSSGGGGSSNGGGSAGDGGGCATDADCGTGKMCGFKTADSCSATGTCFDAPGPGTAMCLAYAPGCACDGSEINLACNGYPSGYASKPVRYTGTCELAVPDAGGTCATDNDCAATQMCAFKIADACSATGSCIARPASGPACQAFSPACTCSDQIINVACTPYPDGYASQPVAYRGTCEAGVVDAGSGFACGNALTCPSTQVCKIGMGGAMNAANSYSCVDYPAACSSMHTCACTKSGLSAQQCAESGGNVTVTFLYP
jgi:hypothetical protein